MIGNKVCVCGGIGVASEDSGKIDNEFNFGYVEVKVHGLFSWLLWEAVVIKYKTVAVEEGTQSLCGE